MVHPREPTALENPADVALRILEVVATGFELSISGDTTGQLKRGGGSPGVTHHCNGIGVQPGPRQKTPCTDGIQQSGHIQGSKPQLFRPRRRRITGEHRLLLIEITAGVVWQQHGVAMGSQHLTPTFKGFRIVPEPVGDHDQTSVGWSCRLKRQNPQGFGPIGHRHLNNLTGPTGAQWLPQSGRRGCSLKGTGQGNPLLKIGFKPVGHLSEAG